MHKKVFYLEFAKNVREVKIFISSKNLLLKSTSEKIY